MVGRGIRIGFASIMVLSQVACLAHSPSIELPISVLAFRCQFISTFGMVAILAHSRSIVLLVHVLALGDLLAVLDSFVVLFWLFFATFGLMGDLVLDLDLIGGFLSGLHQIFEL